MTTVLPFSNNAITVYKYESFSYTISNPYYPTVPVTTVSAGIPRSLVVTDASKVVFSSSGFNGATSPAEVISIDVSGNVSSNSVAILAGRFRDSNGNSMSNASFQFFKNEAISSTQFIASISILAPLQTFPALPAGLTFSQTASNIFTLQGTPLVETPTSNYQIIGMGKNGDAGKVVTTTVPIAVGPERIQLDISGSPIVSSMSIGTAISNRVLTARYPLYSSGNLRYTWDTLPDGIFFTDANGTVRSSGFQPSDASSTLILQGTPTVAAANSFVNAGIDGAYTAGVRASRLTPVPVISNTTAFSFQFEPTVLFGSYSIPAYYEGVALDPSATFFSAKTYFQSDASISTIFALSLPAGLSLNFVSSQSRAYLTGTPTSAGTGVYTIRASNTAGRSRDLQVSIPISNDSVFFDYSVTPAVDTCYNFILSRPLVSDLSGYYTSPIQFKASAVSGRSVTFSAPDLVGTGITLSNVSANVVALSGIPDTVTATKTVTVTASAVGSPATASTTIKLAVLNDQFTFGSIPTTSLVFIQNKAITPIQLSATTLSGRPIISFAASGLPSGLVCSSTGVISGTPTVVGAPTVTITASTGFTTGTTTLTMTVLPDNIIITIPNDTETVPAVFSNVEFDVLTYSGTTGTLTATPTSNRAPQQPVNFSLAFSNNTFLSGNFSVMPALLPAYKFAVTGTAGSLSTSATVNVAVTNPSSFTRHLVGLDSLVSSGTLPTLGTIRVLRNTQVPVSLSDPTNPASFAYARNLLTWTTAYSASNVFFGFHDFAQNPTAIIGVVGSNIVRSLDNGVTWSNVPSSNIQTLAGVGGGPVIPQPPNPVYKPADPLFSTIATDGTSNWVAFGHGSIGNTNIHLVRTSSNNGDTWTDASFSFLFASTPQTKLYYSSGRYFLLSGIPGNTSPSPSNIMYRAEASNLTSWTDLNGPFGFTTGDAINGLALDGSGTLLAVGSNGSGPGTSACYKSTDNGSSWTALPTSPITYSAGAQINNAEYGNGTWAVVGSDPVAQSAISFSSNLTTWDERTALGTGALQVAADDGATWQFGRSTSASWFAGIWSNGTIDIQSGTSAGLNSNTKRFLSTTRSSGTPSLTFSLPYDSSSIVVTSPSTNLYTLWQYIPIDPIRVQASLTGSPGAFLYYYATNLPPALTFLTDDLSGSYADISGTSVQFSDAYRNARITIANASTTAVRTFNLGFRTILPTVQKQQTSAGAWTSLVRQYTNVNAAQNARDNRVFPQVDRTLGEFTSPYPPNVVTQTIDPKCRGECP